MTCRHCGDEIQLTTVDAAGNDVPTTADDPDAVWTNLDGEPSCYPHMDVDTDNEDANCDLCLSEYGHDHEPEPVR
jgi:hypothetical protein